MKYLHQTIVKSLKNYVSDADAPVEPPKEAFEDVMENIEEELNQPLEVILEFSCNALYGFTSP